MPVRRTGRQGDEMKKKMNIEIEREEDGRWLAEVPDLPGTMAYGKSRQEAISRVQALTLRVLADRLEHGEEIPEIIADWVAGNLRYRHFLARHAFPHRTGIARPPATIRHIARRRANAVERNRDLRHRPAIHNLPVVSQHSLRERLAI